MENVSTIVIIICQGQIYEPYHKQDGALHDNG